MSDRASARRRLLAVLVLTAATVFLLAPLSAYGFRDTGDFVVAFSARLLGDLGFERLDIAPALGGIELKRALGQSTPLALFFHTLLFSSAGDTPAIHLIMMLFLHLAVMGTTALVAYQWRPERRTASVAALLVGIHPLAAGTVSGIAPMGLLAATLCILGAMFYTLLMLRDGRFLALIAVLLFAVLAAAFDVFGLLVVPAVAAVSLFAPHSPERPHLIRRIEPPVAAFVGVAATYFVLRALPETLDSWLLLTSWRPSQLSDATGWLLRALFLPALGGLATKPTWLAPLVIAIPAALMSTISLMRLFINSPAPRHGGRGESHGIDNSMKFGNSQKSHFSGFEMKKSTEGLFQQSVMLVRRRASVFIWPALILLSLIPAALALQPLRQDAPASAWAALYPALIFFALWVADIWPSYRWVKVRSILTVSVALLVIPQAVLMVQAQVVRARTISHMGEELAQMVAKLPNGTDILLPATATTSDLIEAAFLSAYYRGVEPKQVRYRMLISGWLAVRKRAVPSGQALGRFTRLPLEEGKQIIGLDATHRHLIDLTDLVHTKIRIAQDILENERREPPPLALADEAVIDSWLEGNVSWQNAEPGEAGWFIEGIMLRLHPHTGRMSF